MNYLISMYIDNELSIDDKIVFVEHLHTDQRFTDDAVSFLKQEKTLRSSLAQQVPDVALPFLQRSTLSFLAPKPLGMAIAASVLFLFAFFSPLAGRPEQILKAQQQCISTGLSYTSPGSARLK